MSSIGTDTGWWCGRVIRHTHWLPHSSLFPLEFSSCLCICWLSYNFPFLCCSYTIKLLIIVFFNFELQVDLNNIPEDLQTFATNQSLGLITCHMSSRFVSRFTLTSRRNGYGYKLCFIFYKYFYLHGTILLKIQDFDMFPHSRLVNIQLDGLICQTVGLHGVIWVCSAPVVGPGDVTSIEHLNDGPIPESSLAVDVPRRGLDDPRPTIILGTMSSIILFLSLHPNASVSLPFLFYFSLLVLWLAQEYVHNHMYVVSPMLFCI